MTGGAVPDWIGGLRVLLRCDFALLLVHAHLKDLSQVQRLAVRGLRNLLPATESVGNDQGFFRRAAHGGKQHALATGQGNFEVVPLFIAESTRHPTAARIEHLVIQAGLVEDLLLVGKLHDGLVVAMRLYDGFAVNT